MRTLQPVSEPPRPLENVGKCRPRFHGNRVLKLVVAFFALFAACGLAEDSDNLSFEDHMKASHPMSFMKIRNAVLAILLFGSPCFAQDDFGKHVIRNMAMLGNGLITLPSTSMELLARPDVAEELDLSESQLAKLAALRLPHQKGFSIDWPTGVTESASLTLSKLQSLPNSFGPRC